MAQVIFEHVSKTFADGTRALIDFNLCVQDGEFMVLVGPSGCGKSTSLRLLAGLDTATTGNILIDNKIINDVAPQHRNVAMVFQNYALYPHMTVRKNLSFPLKMMRLTAPEITQRVQDTAEMLELTALLERKPKQLSGGQRQRVAMGRALVRDPRVFLMDEPLSNLDAKLRVQIRGELSVLQKQMGTTTLYVTHDQAEAMTLGDRVAVMNEGCLQQLDTPQRLYEKPANIFVARFIGNPGMNFFTAQLLTIDNVLCAMCGEYQLPFPTTFLEDHDGLLQYINQSVLIGVRPEDLHIAESEKNAFPAHVESIENLGHEQLIYLTVPWAKNVNLVARQSGFYALKDNNVLLQIDPNKVCFFTVAGEAIS